MNRFDEMRQAVADARLTLKAADDVAEGLAQLLVGRLHLASKGWQGNRAVKSLKRELQNFDLRTGEWK